MYLSFGIVPKKECLSLHLVKQISPWNPDRYLPKYTNTLIHNCFYFRFLHHYSLWFSHRLHSFTSVLTLLSYIHFGSYIVFIVHFGFYIVVFLSFTSIPRRLSCIHIGYYTIVILTLALTPSPFSLWFLHRCHSHFGSYIVVMHSL